MNEDHRHLKLFYLSGDLLCGFFSEGLHTYLVVSDSLPPDTKIISATWNRRDDTLILLLEHPSFEYVIPGTTPSELNPVSIERSL